ncbi:hypothetical protein F4604DRAFT_1678205 [Suillus subluteus]|nr:hypothetical protein F4604DRAFT_1678205 [Suillus subluteus]
MALHIYSDDEEAPVRLPKQVTIPSAKQTQTAHKGKKCACADDGNNELSVGAGSEPDALLNEVGTSTTINAPAATANNELDTDRFLKDMQVMDIDEPEKLCQEQQGHNINKKISAPYCDDKGKKHCHCVLCSKKVKKPVAFVNEVMTMHHHMDALHWD